MIKMENLEQHRKELNNTSFDLETIFKSCPDGIVCKDRDLNIYLKYFCVKKNKYIIFDSLTTLYKIFKYIILNIIICHVFRMPLKSNKKLFISFIIDVAPGVGEL